MGCQSSSVPQKPLGIRINILDSNFTKEQNQQSRQRMAKLHINYQVYLSLQLLLTDMTTLYTNQIITKAEFVKPLQHQLAKINFHPNIYAISTDQQDLQKSEASVKYFASYMDVIQALVTRTSQRRSSLAKYVGQKRKTNVVLKIFRNIAFQSSEEIIFQQTLKAKNITFEIYKSFADLQGSLQTKTSDYIITDYVYHREVINMVEKTSTRVICFCDFEKTESYDPKTYFVTNNFLEIASQITSQEKFAHLNSVKCSKVYIFADHESYMCEYANTLQNFNLEVKIYSDIKKIIHQSKYFFAVTILLNPQNRNQVQRQLQLNNYQFKAKLIDIKQNTQNSVHGLRKIIKEIKKGYKAQKGITRSIDIIDKHFDNVKFDTIKKQLQEIDITVYGYDTINSFIKNKKCISPFLICNFQERSLVTRYLKQVSSKTKLIIFCNKNHITSQLKSNKSYSFVSSHFGKIINYVKKNQVYNPYIIDENDQKIKQKKQKFKKNNKRISALKWSGQNSSNKDKDGNISHEQLQKMFQFINISSQTSTTQITSIQQQFASLFKLDTLPLQKPQMFKQNFIRSLRKLMTIFKINYPQNQFQKMISQISTMSTHSLINKMKQFFSSQNELGIKINNSLIDVQKMAKEEIQHLRQFLFCINLNFLSVYRTNFIGRKKLYHYLNLQLIEQCEVGSFILNKNFSIFYEQSSKEKSTTSLASYIIELELENNSLAENNPQYNSYFQYNDKIIFSPYSQFLIKKIQKTPDATVVTVELKKNVQFLKSYFVDNMQKKKNTLISLYDQELMKNLTQQKKSFLFDEDNKENFVRNLLRTKALVQFQNNRIQQAIKLQKQTIAKQQALENFDGQKLVWLTYQLACYYFKNQNHAECQKILDQLTECEPIGLLGEKVKALIKFYKQRQQKKKTQTKQGKVQGNGIQSNNIQPTANQSKTSLQATQSNKQIEQNFRTIVLQTYYPDSQVDKPQTLSQSSNKSRIQNVFEMVQIESQLPCLQIDRIQDFENDCKQNLE